MGVKGLGFKAAQGLQLKVQGENKVNPKPSGRVRVQSLVRSSF